MTAERPLAAVPGPDADRVSAIRLDLDPSRPETFDSFGETARDGLRTACRTLIGDAGQTGEAVGGLSGIRDATGGLNPNALTPRRGLAGLFDSRNRRLKRMRESFESADRRIASLVDDLQARVAALKSRAQALEPRHEAVRAPIVELGAWIEAGRQRLADLSDDAPDGATPPRQRLSDRLEGLAATRMAAIGQLPLTRILQNVDASAAERLETAAKAAQAWRDERPWGWKASAAARFSLSPRPCPP
jgi:hypothetical protein